IGFAIPIDAAQAQARRLLAGPPPAHQAALRTRVSGTGMRAGLGVAVRGVRGGVEVERVAPGSIGASIGLEPGDVINWMNGSAVSSPRDFARREAETQRTGQV